MFVVKYFRQDPDSRKIDLILVDVVSDLQHAQELVGRLNESVSIEVNEWFFIA